MSATSIDLSDRAALVTGAASGIGRAVAEDLATHGACIKLAMLRFVVALGALLLNAFAVNKRDPEPRVELDQSPFHRASSIGTHLATLALGISARAFGRGLAQKQLVAEPQFGSREQDWIALGHLAPFGAAAVAVSPD